MTNEKLQKTWSLKTEEILDALQVDREKGLLSDGVKQRRGQYGRNILKQQKPRSALSLLLDQFKSFVIILLAAAGIVSFVLGHRVEAIAVLAAILVNTVIGFFTEFKAVRSMDALRKLSRVATRVRRDGSVREISAEELVVGDIVPLEAGDIIPADLRLLEANKLQVNESPLTGESEPVTKETEPKPEETSLAERACMAFKGTSTTRGSGEGIVVAVGKSTELGQIQTMVEEAEDETTPLEKRLNRLAHRLIWVVIGLTAVVGVVGMISGKNTAIMIKSAIALAVAAIPEGLPIVATVALARGMLNMARRNALVNKLASVETLGATSIIGADKTGTLTENRMTVRKLLLGSEGTAYKLDDVESQNSLEDNSLLAEAVRIGVLCNNASLSEDTAEADGSGDPMEVALLAAGRRVGIERKKLLEELQEKKEVAFNPDTKMMATIHKQDDNFLFAVKGAPGAVVDVCSHIVTTDGPSELSEHDRKKWLERNDELANDGLRVLALAKKESSNKDEEPYEDLTLIGLVGLLDPAREDVPEAIAKCNEAGIRVIMITGDQPGTARKIAADIGLADDDEVFHGRDLGDEEEIDDEKRERIRKASIFARVTPRQKLTIIKTHRDHGAVVAMTGDGVNDAPALKQADIGIAMGKRGTQVAKQAADMILQDDAFPTILVAVRQGRVIFENIRKFVVYLLSGNVAEILAVAAASMTAWPLPLLPLQILFLNLVLDVFPALALGVGQGDPHIMRRSPRPSGESVLTTVHWAAITIYGVVIAMSVLAALWMALHWLNLPPDQAVTISFLSLSFSRMWHVFNMRDKGSSMLNNEITRNKFVWAALGLCLILIVGATQVSLLAGVLSLVSPGVDGWALAVAASLVPLVVGQFMKKLAIIKV